MQQRYLVRAHETVAGKQAQRPPHVMNRHEQPGLVLSTDLKRLTAHLPEVVDLSAVRCWFLHGEQLCKH